MSRLDMVETIMDLLIVLVIGANVGVYAQDWNAGVAAGLFAQLICSTRRKHGV